MQRFIDHLVIAFGIILIAFQGYISLLVIAYRALGERAPGPEPSSNYWPLIAGLILIVVGVLAARSRRSSQ